MLTVSSLMGNSQRLDGGAMFGNAPKALWSKWLTPDEQNRVPLCCRCFLVENEGTTILLETGIGAFFEPRLKDRFGVVEDEHVLIRSLAERGLHPSDIDVIILSHLHFDHAGGLLSAWTEETTPRLLFPNAQIITSEQAWERATNPHPRDRASFIPALHQLLVDSGRLHLVSGETSSLLGPNFQFHYSHGHTPGLLLTELKLDQGPALFGGDLIPGAPWVHVPITMGYDRYPELLIDEKKKMLDDLYQRNGSLLLTHDHQVAWCAIGLDSKGKYYARDSRATVDKMH